MIKLKNYQENTLEILRSFLERCCFEDVNEAYNKIQTKHYGHPHFKPFQPLEGLENVPYICLRLPTGGGKTLLSTHTISIAAESYFRSQYPLTLWLVPTNTIKLQTLETLTNPNHANYQVLEKAFNGKFRVFDIADFRQIRPQDISNSTCIVISTFASLRVDKTEGRKAYDHDENLEPHFSSIPSNTDGMEKSEDGKIKFSFANLLYWHRSLVIVDEAHNSKTKLSMEVLCRINASCVVEYTATPADNSNLIASISAAELKAEEMIKLPIILSEHISWEQAITASIQTRQKLEEIAIKDKDYIRPIILFQAENKDKEITVEILENHLIENEGIDRKQIAVVTGDQKELDSINLFNPNCEIRYVITVQALKEGWDCSFAYVLCSVANTKSSTSVEQLLGRVLRMPYAKQRTQPELNKAYAHVSSPSWPHAATQLRDHLVGMGFEQQEAEICIFPQLSFTLGEEKSNPFVFTVLNEPNLSGLTLFEHSLVNINKISDQLYEVKIEDGFNKELEKKLIASVVDSEDKQEIILRAKLYFNRQLSNSSPAARGDKFVIPQLCLNFDDSIELAETEVCLDRNGWSLLDYPTILTKDEFTIDEQSKQYVVDLEGQKMTARFLQVAQQLSFKNMESEFTDTDLCIWLNTQLRANDIKQEILLKFLQCIIKNLLARDDLDILTLNRGKYALAIALKEKIAKYRKQAYKKGYQSSFFGNEAIVTVSPETFSFSFDPNNYPTNIFYEGDFSFNKHYYPQAAPMNGEEALCAFAIDQHPKVKYWVKNLDCNPKYAFWLPTSTDKFYPDFIIKLNNEKLLIIEYKGEHLDNEDTKEKELIGKVWAKESGNLFLIAWKKDEEGRNLSSQINEIIS